jgi:hypothetical protein
MTLKEAQILTLRVLKQVMEEKLDQHNVQLAEVKNIRAFSPRILSLLCSILCSGDTRQRVRDSR